jgi:translation initiation factor 6
MAVYRTEFFGNPTLGLLGLCAEDVCYLPPEIPLKQAERIAKTLGVHTKKIILYNSYLIGLFSAANAKYFFVPGTVEEEETKAIEEMPLGKTVIRIQSVLNTLGNLILCNDKGCILSPYFREKKHYFEEKLGLKTSISTISDLPFPGIGAYATNNGCLVHEKALDAEVEIIEKTLGVKVVRAEFYDGFPGTEILANSKGILVPKTIKGQAMAEIQEALKVF